MKVRLLAALAGCLTLGLVLATAADEKKEEKTPTIKEVMKKLPGKEGVVAKVAALGKDEKWDDAAKLIPDIKSHGEALAKNSKPKKGTDESWEKLSKAYAENTAAISTAVESKDKKALGDAVKTFGGSCMGCHTAHRGK